MDNYTIPNSTGKKKTKGIRQTKMKDTKETGRNVTLCTYKNLTVRINRDIKNLRIKTYLKTH